MSSLPLAGVACALAAALLGAGWQLATRHGVTTTLGPWDLACLRYGVPALVLLPLWLRTGLKPRGMGGLALALLVAGGGLPFGLLVVGGAQYAPAAHLGVFMAGTMPLFTALLAWIVDREPVASAWRGSRQRRPQVPGEAT
jgi:drug/metabolite transporter (DMT)-like permease